VALKAPAAPPEVLQEAALRAVTQAALREAAQVASLAVAPVVLAREAVVAALAEFAEAAAMWDACCRGYRKSR
jgi:hypothetical protein